MRRMEPALQQVEQIHGSRQNQRQGGRGDVNIFGGRLVRARGRGCFFLRFVVTALGMAGCASMTQDVDAYYRQMAYNYREAGEKAKVDEVTLDSQAKALATTGELHDGSSETKRELERVKAGKRSARSKPIDSRKPRSGPRRVSI